ncbi:superfamily II DNA/RNA helicase [Catenuloplanes nepalensis]|uniref:Superfamily II DNA/RNA helicase n=1 Tax=Catenuloplanes nepalensis TaxID=587533 RepID=A0ABT9MU81_9ACTN|nr:DEAD/DEAH box helicase [Catenuloplanes nepalensis]MDP9794929.1 superfamily II DNA/RNA helicase [Catenuloplanes nepalensis]
MAARRPRSTTSPTTFSALGVPAPIVEALAGNGITTPFPIQAATLPDALAGRDVLGRGRTGSGKTYAFSVPLLARLMAQPAPRRPGRPRALILAPTRELATQIEASIAPLAEAVSLRTLTVFGGVSANRQIARLRAGTDVLVACPGRLLELVEGGHANLDAVEITVLDEADHMADLGFLPSVRRLLDQTPRRAQRLLFSATLDAGVDVLVRRYLTDPITHSVDVVAAPVAVPHHMLHIGQRDMLTVLVDLAAAPGRTLVFTRTKRRAKTLTRQLVAAGVSAIELHGNLGQNARSRNLTAFAAGTATTLVATDIAARGIHVDDVALVVHADPPAEFKAYLHRSGRTARAGATGTVITLMTDDQVDDVRHLARQAGITATTTRLRPGDPFLQQIVPGPRTLVTPPAAEAAEPARNGGRGRPRSSAATAEATSPRRKSRSRATGSTHEDRPAATAAGREGRAAAGREGRAAAGREGRAAAGREGRATAGREGRATAGREGRAATREGRAAATREGRPAATREGQPAAQQATGAAAFSAGSRVGATRRGGRAR